MTRAARGEGKGEKALFYRLLHGVWTHECCKKEGDDED